MFVSFTVEILAVLARALQIKIVCENEATIWLTNTALATIYVVYPCIYIMDNTVCEFRKHAKLPDSTLMYIHNTNNSRDKSRNCS